MSDRFARSNDQFARARKNIPEPEPPKPYEPFVYAPGTAAYQTNVWSDVELVGVPVACEWEVLGRIEKIVAFWVDTTNLNHTICDTVMRTTGSTSGAEGCVIELRLESRVRTERVETLGGGAVFTQTHDAPDIAHIRVVPQKRMIRVLRVVVVHEGPASIGFMPVWEEKS